MHFRCPNCRQPVEIEESNESDPLARTLNNIECPSCHHEVDFLINEASTTISLTGQNVAHFEVHSCLGEGSFGTVYKAWDTELGRYVALKVPREGRISSRTSKSFIREARAAAGVKHPNVVTVYEIGQHDENYYIASEFIDGQTLREYLFSHTLTFREMATLVEKMLRAIGAFHKLGIIHRDLKPGNVLIDKVLEPHIADFGLARSETVNDLTVTREGTIVGTLLYMSPEQAKGDAQAISARSDQYSVGVILYELLTGRTPYHPTTDYTVLQCIQNEAIPAPTSIRRDVPRDLETICLKAIEREADRRYESAEAMADDIQRFLDGRPILARRASLAERFLKIVRRNRLLSAMVVAVLLLAFTASILLMRPPREKTSERSPASAEINRKSPMLRTSLTYTLTGSGIPADSRANWTIYPLDSRTREPVAAKAVSFDLASAIDLELEPGQYLIVVSVPGFGFHEVYRTVPQDAASEYNNGYLHESWNVAADGIVNLPPINILSESLATHEMVEVPPGEFAMGDDELDRSRHRVRIAAFYVDPHEVTADTYEQFRKLTLQYLPPRGQFAVAVRWNDAVAFAEYRGRRLMTEEEYEYLATDLGKTKYPSGNESPHPSDEPWLYGVVGEPTEDRMGSLPVFGLYSNVAEWTDSVLKLYPGQQDPGLIRDQMLRISQSRVVRGGPVFAGLNDRNDNLWSHPPAHRQAFDTLVYDTEIGFRCVRSKSARVKVQ